MDSGNRKIPFVKPARVGNYKIWRTRVSAGKGKDKMDIEQICVSDLEGLWQTKVPATSEAFAMLSELYADERNNGALSSILTNMLAMSSIYNGYFHRAVQMCLSVYFNPDLLRKKKERKDLIKEAKRLAADFLDWRDMYEGHVEMNTPTEEEERSDEVLEEILEETENQSED